MSTFDTEVITVTVGELIEALSKFPRDIPVQIQGEDAKDWPVEDIELVTKNQRQFVRIG